MEEQEITYPLWMAFDSEEAFEARQAQCFEAMKQSPNFKEGDTRYADAIIVGGKYYLPIQADNTDLFTSQELESAISQDELVALRDLETE